MKHRLLSVLLALAMLLSLLTGCARRESDYFFDLAEEMAAVKDAEVSFSMPYAGAQLQVGGYISPSLRRADLTVSLSGTEKNDGPLTQLLVDGSQVWLNVRQLAESALSFEMHEYYKSDIEGFYQEQFADWLIYEGDETLWSGIDGWEELLAQLWEDLQGDLAPHITGEENRAVLSLSQSQSGKVAMELASQLMRTNESYQEGFLAFAQREHEFFRMTGLDAADQFETWVAELEAWIDAYDAGEVTLPAAEITLSKEEDTYTLSMEESGQCWTLTVSPAQEHNFQRPVSVMEFEAYGDVIYYLISFSFDYMAKTLSGEELDLSTQQAYESEQEEEYYRDDMTTFPISGYEDISAIQFIPDGGLEMNVPIFSNFLGNMVTVAQRGAPYISDLSLEGLGWRQYVTSQDSLGKNAQLFIEDQAGTYYNNLINISGFQLVQDLSALQKTANGSAYAQGFVYRNDNYSDSIALLFILLPQEGCSSYTQIELNLELAVLSESDRLAVDHLFESLGLECPLNLEP